MLVGQQIGPFQIERELGSGAMGAVYLARYGKTGQRVAIKIIAPGLSASEKALARFDREAAVLKQLRHDHIVRLLASGKFQGTSFYAMEYIEGETLDEVLRRRDRFTWEEVVEIGKQLCAALQHAHANGIIHRDLKPSNIMITRDGAVKLTDFGIAKDLDVTQLTTANCTVGTAAYMSPEQCRGERDLTHKSDLYSLGVLFYELVTGRKPFHAESALDMFMEHVKGKFERPSRLALEIPVWLDTLICQLLEKKPEQRPVDAAMVAKVLEEVVQKVGSLQSAGVRAARKVARKGKDESDRNAARTLLDFDRKRPKKRGQKPSYQKWFTATGLSLGVLGIIAVITYAFWPASPEQLYEQGMKLTQKGDELFAQGDEDAWYEWDKAESKYFHKIVDKHPSDPLAEKAKEQIAHIEAGKLYLKGRKFLTGERKDWKKAKSNGFDQLLNDYPADNKFVEKARNELQPLEAPELWGEGRKLATLTDSEDRERGREMLERLTKRYPDSSQANAARNTLNRLLAQEVEDQALKKLSSGGRAANRAESTALEALELEKASDNALATQKWNELMRFPVNDDTWRWVLLARLKLGQLEN